MVLCLLLWLFIWYVYACSVCRHIRSADRPLLYVCDLWFSRQRCWVTAGVKLLHIYYCYRHFLCRQKEVYVSGNTVSLLFQVRSRHHVRRSKQKTWLWCGLCFSQVQEGNPESSRDGKNSSSTFFFFFLPSLQQMFTQRVGLYRDAKWGVN